MVFMIILATLAAFLAIECAGGVGTSLASSPLPSQAMVCVQSELCAKMS